MPKNRSLFSELVSLRDVMRADLAERYPEAVKPFIEALKVHLSLFGGTPLEAAIGLVSGGQAGNLDGAQQALYWAAAVEITEENNKVVGAAG